MRQDYPIISADILIIGGGSAGAMAAIRAKEVAPDQKVVVFEKGDFLYSGCIARGMDALNIVAIPGHESPELYIESNAIACEGVMDDAPSYIMAKRSWETMQKLISMGVYFPQNESGEYERLQVHPKGRFCVTMKEPELKSILAKRAMALGAKIYNRTMAVSLIKNGDQVVGAVGINVRTGELFVCLAKAVILSSGGTARFGLPNSGYLYGVFDFPGNTGDGYMLGYRAGAEISGLEYTMVSYLIKDINTPLLYIVLTRGAHLFNAFDTPLHDNHPNISMMLAEYMAERGPCRINLSHLPESRIKEVEDILFATERPAMERFFKGRNVDFRSGEIELWFTECYLCGGHGLTGLVVNERAECSIAGLYAAGDTSLVARGHLTGALVFGMISAEQGSAFAERAPKPVLPEDQVEAIIADQKAKLSQDKNPIAVEEFEFKVRRLISDYIRPPKNGYKLKRALWWADRFHQEARTMVRVQNMHDLFKLYEVENIIQCAKLSATASLERTESRWGMWHYRSDFPKRDNDNWLKHIILKRGEDAWEPQISHRAISKMEVLQ